MPTIAIREVPTLYHEFLDDTVEGRSLVTKAFLSSAESSEVFGGLWDRLAVKTDHDSAQWLIAVSDIKVNLDQRSMDVGYTFRCQLYVPCPLSLGLSRLQYFARGKANPQ